MLKKILMLLIRLTVLYAQRLSWTIFPRRPKKILTFERYDPEKFRFIVIFASRLQVPDVYANALLSLFKKEGGFVVFVTNHPTPQPDRIRREIVDVFIANGGFGRDMGQYRSASIFLKEKIGNHVSGKVLYCNDSVFYLERNDGSFVEELLNPAYDLIGTFENPGREEIRAPWFISSWLFSVSPGLFSSRPFSDFFYNYKAINNKRHAIHAGEIQLTKVAVTYSGKVKAIYNNRHLITLLRRFAEQHGVEAATSIVTAPMRDEYETTFRLPATKHAFIDYVEQNLYRFSPTHVFVFLLLKETSFPFLKKDLFWAGGARYDQLSDLDDVLAKCCTRKTADDIRRYFRLRGKPGDAPTGVRIALALDLV